MNMPYVWMLFLAALVLILIGLSGRGRIYEFPFMAGATFMGFVVPQVFALVSDPGLAPDSVARTLIFTTLCVAMCGFGWYAAKPPQGRLLHWEFDERRLLIVAALLSLMGAYFFYKIGRLPEEVRNASMPSGRIVIYLFFANLTTYGFVVAILCFARRFSWTALAIVLFDSVFLVDRVIVTGKRGEFTQFGLAILLAFWFQRGRAIPRWLALAGAITAAVALSSAEDYREISRAAGPKDWSRVEQIDVFGNFTKVIEAGAPEMHNAVVRMESVIRTQAFDFGAVHWNMFVYAFVPSQIVGGDFKKSLMIKGPSQFGRDYRPALGSTETGMTDAFASFWYFGALKFFLIAFAMAKLYRSAMQGWALSQIIYMCSITPSMHTITHFTQWLVSAWFILAVMLLPALWLARVSRHDVRSTAVRVPGTGLRHSG